LEKAKIFWSGRSQAVRLPKRYRFNCGEVRIRRHGNGILLEPVAQDWDWLRSVVGPVDDDFARDASDRPSEQARPELNFFR